ncbi:MAG: hypothetical protein ACREDC_05695 [Bradyrhizobium sp.]
MSHTICNRFASITLPNDDGVPGPRVTLERTVRNGRVCWVASEHPDHVIADGRNATWADIALRDVYAWGGWDLRMGACGSHRLAIGMEG